MYEIKIGKTVKLIEITPSEIEYTNLKVGDIGTIKSEFDCNCGDELDGYYVDFGSSVNIDKHCINYKQKENSYGLWAYMVEIIG